MKTKTIAHWLITITATSLFSTLVFGAEESRPGTPRPETPDRTETRPERPARAERRPERLVPAVPRPEQPAAGRFGGPGAELTESQRNLLREALEANREEFGKLNEKIRDAEAALKEAALADKFDEKVVKEKAEVLAKLQAEQMFLRLKLFSAVAPSLTPDQRERINRMPAGAIGTLLVGPGGPGGPGGRGGMPGMAPAGEPGFRPNRFQEGMERPPR
jgi:Spy/CpxP family protein refolding chaperone